MSRVMNEAHNAIDSNDRLLPEDATSESESRCADRPADLATTLRDRAPKIGMYRIVNFIIRPEPDSTG